MSAEIEPYRISVGDDVLDDLELRLRNTLAGRRIIDFRPMRPRIDLMQLSRTACISGLIRESIRGAVE
jgi:hypothetical protein